MRTTLDIDIHLLKALRAEANRRGVPFKEVVAGALRRGLTASAPARKTSYRCPTFAMGVPKSGYDLDKALRLAATLEDDEITRKLAARQ